MAAGMYPDRKHPDYEPTTNVTEERRSAVSERISWEEQERRIEESVRLRDGANKQWAELLESYRCVVCGEPGGPHRLWSGRQVALCNTHISAWNEYLLTHSLWLEGVELEAIYNVAVYGGDKDTALQAKRRVVELQMECYELSGKWLEEERVKWQKR